MFLFAIVELSFFWKSNVATQNLANQMASNAATYWPTSENTAGFLDNMQARLETGKLYKPLIGKDLTFKIVGMDTLVSNSTDSLPEGKIKVQIITLYADEGIIDTQVSFTHETVLLKAEYVLPNGKSVTVIPNKTDMQSSWVRQYFKY